MQDWPESYQNYYLILIRTPLEPVIRLIRHNLLFKVLQGFLRSIRALFPGDLFKLIMEYILKQENQKIKDFSKNNINKEYFKKFFGEWSWNLEVESEIHTDVQKIFKEKLTEYYKQGIIRYASW